MVQTRQIVLASRPQGGKASPQNFRMESADLPEPGPGEVTVRVIWLSLDPYMRGRMDDARSYVAPFALDKPLDAGAVGQVVASNDDSLKVGDIVTGMMRWREYDVLPAKGLRKVDPAHGPIQRAVSVLGMPGMTAWVGLIRIGEAKPGDTVVVSAATGAVGSVVGQIAKARGMRVIGIAGGAEKCRFAVEELGFDICLDHRAGDVQALSNQIKDAAPDGVNVYYENVGGKTLAAVFPRMADFGRIALCGAIAWYDGANMDETMPLPWVWTQILKRRLKVQGFIVSDHGDATKDFIAEVGPLSAAGKIKLHETIAEGLEAAPDAMLGMLEGKNFGKQLVRIGADPE